MAKYNGREFSESTLEKHAKHEARDVTQRIMKEHGEHWVRIKGPDGQVFDPRKPQNRDQARFAEIVRKESRCLTRK